MNEIKRFSVDKIKVDSSDSDFLKLKFYAISEGINRNGSNFTSKSLELGAKTIYNKPILAYFNQTKGDFEEHNYRVDYDAESGEVYPDFLAPNAEKMVGIIPESSNIRIEKYRGKNWLTFTGLIIKEYNKQVVSLLQKKGTNKTSVEVIFLNSEFDSDGIEICNDFKFLGITLLGDDIAEGMQGSHLSLENIESDESFLEFKSRIFKMLDKNFVSEELVKSKPALKVNKSKEAMSDDSWGSVDKARLADEVIMASNFNSVAHDVYMKLESGWETGSDKSLLKYPVMQLKSGTLVYNAGGLSSALGYAKKENESAVVSKVESIRKKLGLETPDKEKGEHAKMGLIKNVDESLSFSGTVGNTVIYYKEGKFYGYPEPAEEEEFDASKLVSYSFKPADEEKSEEEDKEKKEMAQKQIEEMSAKVAQLESEIARMKQEAEAKDFECGKMAQKEQEFAKAVSEFEQKLQEKDKELESVKQELCNTKMAEIKKNAKAVVDEDEELTEDEKKEYVAKIDANTFSCFEDFEKDFAYAKYKKAKAFADKQKSLRFDLTNNGGKRPAEDKVLDPVEKAVQLVNKDK